MVWSGRQRKVLQRFTSNHSRNLLPERTQEELLWSTNFQEHKIQGHVSEFLEVNTGIGEGLVLGPLVFLICILETSMIAEVVKEMLEDDEPEVGLDTQTSTVCFADDTTVLLSTSSDENMEKAMTVCSEQFGRYFSTQGMKVNMSKEEHIVFYPKKMERSLENGVVIKGRKEAETVKLLGLSVSMGYSFKNHCSKIISKTNQRLGHVRRLQKYLSAEKLQQVTDLCPVHALQNWIVEY